MSGNLDREWLRELVESNEIDTILVCFPDMQRRLLGKRVTGHFFLEHVIHEMHVCDYLLTVDMEMTPVPGYQAALWALGYGDLGVRPDLDTLRRIPWLPGTALVLGDCVDHDGNDLRHSPRAILKRQIERAAAAGYSAKMGSELEFYLFADEAGEHGMSKLFRHYLAGQLKLAQEMTYFFAPYINSYKRFQAASFAPTNAVWGTDNRTVGFRVLGPGPSTRVECRIPGADANPYLAFAATLAAGLHGIEEELELEPIFEGDAYAAEGIREVPKTLREALHALDGSTVLRGAFGDDVIDHYLHAGRREQSEYDRRITDWEVRRTFEQA